MEKIITIKKSTEEFFRAYIEILRPFLNKLTNKEADILAEIVHQNYIKRDIKDKSDRFKLILDSDNRRLIEDKLGITSHTFRNALTSFKAKRLSNESNEIKDICLVIPDKNFKLVFNFIIEDNDKEE